MLRLIILLTFIILFIACDNNKQEQTKLENQNILSKERFTELMLDVQLVEGHLNVNRVNQVFLMDSSKNYYKEVFNRYAISFEDYKENIKYYTARPLVLEEVYKKVEEKLVIQERLYANVLIDQPAISPINRNQLLKVLLKDTAIAYYMLDTTVEYKIMKDSIFSFYNDSLLKENNTNALSFQQSFNVMTHTKPMFRMFKNELKNKLEQIKED